jgi:hypothetical protein
MWATRRWRNLGVAAGAAAAVLFAVFDLYQWALASAADRFHNDFTFYYTAARIGLLHGWSQIYNLRLQQLYLDDIGSQIHVAELARFISPPPVAWLAAPLTTLPYTWALAVWTILLLVAIVLTWLLAAPGSGLARLIYLAAAIGWLPVIYALQLEQPGPVVALGVAACYALLRANRPVWAGVALGSMALKPQLAFLVPLALLVAGQSRAFLGSASTLGFLAVASMMSLGSGGIAAYMDRLNFASSVPVNQEFTLAPLIGSLAVTRVVQALIALWSLTLVYRMRRRGPEWIFVPALVGGMLASPYLHLDDFLMLGIAAWLVLQAKTASWTWAYLLGMVIAVEGEPFWGPVPVLAGEVLALVLISVAALKADDRDAQHDQSEREHDGHLQRDRQQTAPDRQTEAVDKGVRQA